MTTCPICNNDFKNLCRHMQMKHSITKEEFHTVYNPPQIIVAECPICKTNFKNNGRFKKICCSQECAARYRQSKYTHTQDVERFEKEHNCTSIVKLRETYGQGWYKAGIITEYIEGSIQTQTFFVKNEDIPKIIEYASKHLYNGKSHIEKYIVKAVKDTGIEVVENNKKLIYPKELDMYLPDYNIAVEFNGTWYHSIEHGCSEDYHLTKSLMCREKGIRLIHIYEFENINKQVDLLLNLLVCKVDDYPKNDFNKNNLIETIPTPELVYTSSDKKRPYHVYGAGKLY